jgi:hypothetical protein
MIHGILDDSGNIIASFVVPLTVKSNQPVFVSDTLSLKRAIQRRSSQRWEIETRLSPLKESANDLMVNFITKGFDTIHQIIVPQNYAVFTKTTAAGLVQTDSVNRVAGVNQLAIAMTAINAGKLIPKGAFIKFANHSKIYMVIENCSMSASQVTALKIFPQLRQAVPAGTLITYSDDVRMSVRYDTEVVTGMVYEDGLLMDNGVIKLIEAL